MSQARDAGRLPISLITYVAWTLVTVFGMRWAGDGTNKPLIESITHGISWNLVMAVALLAIVTVAMRWRDLKFVAPKPMGTLLFVVMNTMLVGLSEEWMFRGVLFQGLRSRLATD